jgi:hypothetical protein
MVEMQPLVDCATSWDGDQVELERIMETLADTTGPPQSSLVSDAAKALLVSASGRLNDHQSLLLHVYIARAYGMHERHQALDSIEQASTHPEILKQVWEATCRSSALVAHGFQQQHPLITELSMDIADLRR